MGTRSTYRIIEKQGKSEKSICLIYAQYDGYPEGHPSETAAFLEKAKIVNGFSSSEDATVFNGAGCLAARLVSRLKGDSIGGFYLYPVEDRGLLGEDYMYDIIVEVGQPVRMIAYDYNTEIFNGTAAEFLAKTAAV